MSTKPKYTRLPQSNSKEHIEGVRVANLNLSVKIKPSYRKGEEEKSLDKQP